MQTTRCAPLVQCLIIICLLSIAIKLQGQMPDPGESSCRYPTPDQVGEHLRALILCQGIKHPDRVTELPLLCLPLGRWENSLSWMPLRLEPGCPLPGKASGTRYRARSPWSKGSHLAGDPLGGPGPRLACEKGTALSTLRTFMCSLASDPLGGPGPRLACEKGTA